MKSIKTRKLYFFTLFHFVIKHFPLQSTDFAQIRKNWCFFKKFNLTPQKKQFSQKKTPFWGIFFFPQKSFIMCEKFSGEVRSAPSSFRLSFCTHFSNEHILAIWRKKKSKRAHPKKKWSKKVRDILKPLYLSTFPMLCLCPIIIILYLIKELLLNFIKNE